MTGNTVFVHRKILHSTELLWPDADQTVPQLISIIEDYELYRFTLELSSGNVNDLYDAIRIVKKHLNWSIRRITTTVVSNEGEIPFIGGTFEALLPLTSPHCLHTLFDLHRNPPRFPTNHRSPFFGFADSKCYSEALMDEVSYKLNSIDFGYRKESQYFSHWIASFLSLPSKTDFQIDYSKTFTNEDHDVVEFCRSNFKVDFVFDQPTVGVTIHLWNNNVTDPEHKDKIDHYTLLLEERSLRRVVLLNSPQNQAQLILESDHPVCIKKRQYNVKDVLMCSQGLWSQRSPGNHPTIHNKPNWRSETVYRGQSYKECAPEAVFYDNRHVLLNFAIAWEETYELISRLHHKFNVEIVSGDVKIIKRSNRYMSWAESTEPCGRYYEEKLNSVLHGKGEKSLILTMRLRALFGLGANIKDQLLLVQKDYEGFINEVLKLDYQKTLLLLESIIKFYQQTTHDASFADVYRIHLNKANNGKLANPYAEIGNDYEISEEIELTPFGAVYKLPEIRLSNMVSRMLKKRGRLPMIRCSLRTETGQVLRWTKNGGRRKIDRRLKKLLKGLMVDGIQILGYRFTFYAASGSQQREEGYFSMNSTDVEYVRQMVGKFAKIPNPFKRLAREGQATSQSMQCSIPITKDMWDDEEDLLSNNNTLMTDGSGRISEQLAKEIYQDKKLGDCVPSGFQFRFHGFKGMLWIDKRLEGRQIVFRKSQEKFIVKDGNDPHNYLQIIKYTGPQKTSLSANYINIIGQNAEIQGEGLERITEAVLRINEKALMTLFEGMKDETRFRQTYSGLPFIIDHSKIGTKVVMNQDPFFHRCVRALILKKLSYLLHNNRLPVDPDFGRSAFGGPDDLNALREEEVYFEATKCVENKFPSPLTETEVYTGSGLVAKYPCCHQGDVRLVKFVDVPEYHGMRDKLIFSVEGSRPVADMLSGSDYDGDEYVIVRLPELFPEKNEAPMDYTPTKPEKPPTTDQMDVVTWRAETYLNIAENNNMGLVAICQLVKSDEHGQESQVALSLAKTSSMSLDMPKSGVPPEEIRTNWVKDEAGNSLPPEFPYRRPDFRPCSTKAPTYKSEKINGDLHRLNRQLEFLIRDEPQEIDTIMMNGKVATEAELFSDCHLTGIGFDSQKEDCRNVTHLQRAILLFRTFRQRFFDVFAPYMTITGAQGTFNDENVLKRSVKMVDPQMDSQMQKAAVVCYILAYRMAGQSKNPLLSYGWIAYDVLGNALERAVASPNVEEKSIYQILQNKLVALTKEDHIFLNAYPICTCNKLVALKEANLYDYSCRVCMTHEQYLYSLLANPNHGISASLKLSLYGLIKLAESSGLLNPKDQDFHSRLSRFVEIALLVAKGNIEDKEKNGTKDESFGECFLTILGRLSSRKLLEGYGEVDILNNFSREELTKIYENSRKSYFYLLISQNIKVLDGYLPYLFVKERVPRIIELPKNVSLTKVCEKLKAKTGAAEMELKPNESNQNRVTVLYRGSSDCEEALRRLVEVPALKDPKSAKQQNGYYANNVYSNIMK